MYVQGFIVPVPAGGTPAALTADLLNPATSSSGVFGGQVLALRLNVDFSAAGVTIGTLGPVGALKLSDPASSLGDVFAWQPAGDSPLGGVIFFLGPLQLWDKACHHGIYDVRGPTA